MATRADLMVTNVLSLVGNGYAWGATGQLCTQAVLNQLAAQYPAQTNLLKVCPKWIGKRIYDCATLVVAALRAAGITICSGASSQWKGDYWSEKGTIDAMPEDKPCVLYNKSESANPMGHTGIYLGDGTVVDARGSAQGVLHTQLTSRTWSHYAVPRGLYDEMDVVSALVTAPSGSWVRMRRFASDDAGTVRKVPIGEKLTITGKGDEWCGVIGSDGHSGFMMTRFLAFDGQPQAEPPTYTVQLFDASEAERATIVKACARVSVQKNVG